MKRGPQRHSLLLFSSPVSDSYCSKNKKRYLIKDVQISASTKSNESRPLTRDIITASYYSGGSGIRPSFEDLFPSSLLAYTADDSYPFGHTIASSYSALSTLTVHPLSQGLVELLRGCGFPTFSCRALVQRAMPQMGHDNCTLVPRGIARFTRWPSPSSAGRGRS